MSKRRHGTAERQIPKVPRHDFAVEERTLVDVGVSSRVARDEGLIPSIARPPLARSPAAGSLTDLGANKKGNVIPFTKPRAMAAVVAANPNALIIEESAGRALKNFENTTNLQRDEATTKFTSNGPAATGWTPPGAVPTAPVAKATVVPVPALHIPQTAAPKLALPPLQVPGGVQAPAPVARVAAPMPVAAPAPTYHAGAYNAAPAAPAQVAYAAAAYPPAPAQQPSFPIAAWPVSPVPAPQPPSPQPPAPAPAPRAPSPTLGDFMVAQPAVKPKLMDRVKAGLEKRFMRDNTVAEASKPNWAVFEKLGLGAPKKLLSNPQKLIVNVYRLLGFVILTIIVVALVGYIANTAFFYMSDSWVVPMAVSATDEKVVTQQAQLAAQQTARDKIADELAQSERQIAAQQNFQLAFAKAIKSDLDGRKAALGRMRALANTAAVTRSAIKSQNLAYAGANRKRMQQEYDAGLIDRNAMMSGNFQLAQISNSNLSLAERQADFETKAAELEAITRSLDAILSNIDDKDTALSYEVLRIKQEYGASRLDLAKAVEARNTLKAGLARQDKIVDSLKKSSYLRAVEHGAAVAFVPYGNLGKATKGSDVYACKVGMIFCWHVGEVIEVLQGEVQFKHPHRDRMMRGQMVEMKLDAEDADAAAGDVLFVGGKPLFI